MNSNNMHYIYNKEYFDNILLDEDGVIDQNKAIFSFEYSADACQSVNDLINNVKGLDGYNEFSLYTIYPGLMIGSGYPHDSGEKDTIVGGFSFDQITGLPIYPGSSLKGVLRSCFEEDKKELVFSLLGNIENIDELVNDKKIYDSFIENCFEASDIFIGGYPIINDDFSIIRGDYITPHKDALKSPTPHGMLKVKPGVEYKFIFILHDFACENIKITAEDKRNLYKELLGLFGIGAKTNVGFGQLSETKYEAPEIPKADVKKETKQRPKPKLNTPLNAKITGYDKDKTKAYFETEEGATGSLYFKTVGAKRGKIDEMFSIDQKIKVIGEQNGKFVDWKIVK